MEEANFTDDGQFDIVPTFQDLVDLTKWQPVEEYFTISDELIAKDIESCVALRKQLRQELLADPGVRDKVNRPSSEQMKMALETLFSGQVCAVDGTVSIIPSQSGGRARIGRSEERRVGKECR